jgi:hypothetical protein
LTNGSAVTRARWADCRDTSSAARDDDRLAMLYFVKQCGERPTRFRSGHCSHEIRLSDSDLAGTLMPGKTAWFMLMRIREATKRERGPNATGGWAHAPRRQTVSRLRADR